MKLSKLVVSMALVGSLGLLAQSAGAQTMGEYATTTGVSMGSGSMSSASVPSFDTSLGGSTRTWGTASYGASWEERAGANSASTGDFGSRAQALTGHSSGLGESRFPGTGFANVPDRGMSSSDRFGGSGDRFGGGASRFGGGEGRFPAGKFSNAEGLDTSFNSINGN